MPSSITRAKKNRPPRNNRENPNRPRPTTPIHMLGATKNASTITITFNQPVALKGVPQYTTDLAGVTASSASMTSPTVMAVTFSAPITTATVLNIPYEEPAVRNSSGGFVANSSFPLS